MANVALQAQSFISRSCYSAIENSCSSASKSSHQSIQAKLTQTTKQCGVDQMFTSSFKSGNTSGHMSMRSTSFNGGCCPSGHLQQPNFGNPLQALGNLFGGGNGLGNLMQNLMPAMMAMGALPALAPLLSGGLQNFLGGGAAAGNNNQFQAGRRGCGGGQGCFNSYAAMQHATGCMSNQMGAFLGMSQSLHMGANGIAASRTIRTTGKPAHFPQEKGSHFLNTLNNKKHNAKRLNVSGRHDVRTINSAIDKLKVASPQIRPTRPGEKAGPGKLQLTAEETAAIRNAPDLACAKDIVRKAIQRQTGQKFGPINMNDKKGIKSNNNRNAMNKLLGTKVRSGREKNSGSSLVMDTMMENVAKSVRGGSFGTTNVDTQFAAQQFGVGGCHAMGFAASGYSHTSVENAAGPLTVDLGQFKGAANKVGELYSPLIFDLEGQGLKIKNGGLIEVDLDGDGNTETITDLDAHQGLLVFDSKLGETEDDGYALGADLFGNGTDMTAYGIRGPQEDGSFENGFQALRAMAEHFELVHGDKQHLDAADLKLLEDEAGLRMRVGGVDNGEDLTFSEVHISRINLGDPDKIQDIKQAEEDAYGNKLMRQDGATFIVNDVERDYVDIWFNIVAREVTSKTQKDLDLEHIQKQMQVPIIRN